MAKKLVLPRVHVMVLCDDVESHLDEETHDLIGVRTWIQADAFPYTHPLFAVYLQLTGHAGITRCEITIVDADTDEAVFTGQAHEIQLQGPLIVVPVTSWVEDCAFSGPGLYYAQVRCDGKLVCERPLRVEHR
jgi:hypothetical protein